MKPSNREPRRPWGDWPKPASNSRQENLPQPDEEKDNPITWTEGAAPLEDLEPLDEGEFFEPLDAEQREALRLSNIAEDREDEARTIQAGDLYYLDDLPD